MKLSVIIVSWNVRNLLEKCLSSLFEYNRDINFDVFVVDNHSGDQSARMVKEKFPQVKLIENDKNLGFAKANNQALEKAAGEYILLLNPDTEFLDNHALSTVINLAEKRTRAGVFGVRLLNRDMSIQPSVRAFPDFLSQAGILLKLHHLFPSTWFFKKYFMSEFDYHDETDVDQVMGAFFLIKRELLKQIGALDAGYFYWFEEVDYCWQAKKRGWQVVYLPQVEVIHHGGASFKQVLKPKNQSVFNQSMFRFFKKNISGFQAYLIALLFPFSIFLSWCVQSSMKNKKS